VSSVLKIVLQRLGLGFLTLFAVSIIIAFVVELLPGDITQAILGQSATPETVAAFRKEIGLDRPAHIRYFEWLGGMVQGDLGQSLASKREISEFVGTRLSNTLFLGGLAAAIAVPLALILGLLAALYRNSIYDRIVNLLTLTSISFPEFFVAYILILFLSVKAGFFPGISNVSTDLAFSEQLFRTILPALTLTLVVLRSYVANDPSSDY
jgi:peptide/nickel transport system permease protein